MTKIRRFFLLLLVAALLLTSCGGGAAAATMHLRKTQGTVGVSDSEGKGVEPRENLGLYSGYGVGTQSESYAWIDLDSVKLTKLDENSEVEIQKDGKKLEIEVKSGSLFFNVTQPLADDETMEIRTSTMMVGIRGTCGWVEVPDPEHMTLCLLEGTVECTAGENTATVNAGEMAAMTEDGEITVVKFTVQDIPAFVREEVEDDDNLVEAILEASGLDVTDDPLAAYEEFLKLFSVMNEELLHAELLDFEADGNPELMTITLPKDRQETEGAVCVDVALWRNEPDGVVVMTGCSPNLYAGSKISLVESGGRLFIHEYLVYKSQADGSDTYVDRYYGSTAQRDGVGITHDSNGDRVDGDWGCVDELDTHMRPDHSVYQSVVPHTANGMTDTYRSPTTPADAEALLAKYTEVRILVFTPDGKNVMLMPDPSEIEEVPRPVASEPDPVEPDPVEPEPEEPADPVQPQPEEPAAPQEDPTASLLAPYVGTYTMYSEYESYRSGYGGTTVTLNADGTVTGGAVDGRTPSSIRQESNGSIVIMYGRNMWFTLYPANGPTPSAQWYDGSQVNLEFMDAGGGLAVLVYHADPASLG